MERMGGTTRGVTLARWSAGDLPLLHRLNDPEMTAHLGGPETDEQVVARHEKYLRGWETGASRMFRIDVDGAAAGGIGFWPTDHEGAPAYEAGWSVLPELQGRGVATAALALLLRDAATIGDRDVVVAYPGLDNDASNALCRRAGFVHAGSGLEPWRGGELAYNVWALDISALVVSPRGADVDERFDGADLDTDRWWPHYLPHWSSRERTAARYELDGGLVLRIDEDTAPWAPEWDPGLRVSHLQTGQVAGPVGSTRGQHRFRDGLVVREAQPDRRLWLPRYGVIEARMAAIRHPDAMVAFWPIGLEDAPDDSGEICIAEIFGSEIDADSGLVGVGVKAHHDPRLRSDFEKVRVDGDLTQPHDYAVEWDAHRIRFFIDGRWVKTVAQSIDYPVQLMVDVFELPTPSRPRDLAAMPFEFRIERVRTFPATSR